MAALSEDERHRLAILEARQRIASERQRRRALSGSHAALKALQAKWEPVRLYQRERGQDG
jgi:hypothetical protein